MLPRLIKAPLEQGLEETPSMLIHGPRQCGKTTLAQRVGGKRTYTYFNLDDEVVRSAVEVGPVGFVGNLPTRPILDEVMRVSSLFAALKVAVGRERAPGRFLLTGSGERCGEARVPC